MPTERVQTHYQPQFLDFTKTIFDNVHGFIPLTDIEYRIINTQEFQRLRNIRQLGLLDYIFPGALHTRFNHSIGVLHVADKMMKSLQGKGHFLEGDENRQIIRLAGLLHDIGHYPWSHVTESVVIEDLQKKMRLQPQSGDKIIVTSGSSNSGTLAAGSFDQGEIDLLNASPCHAINKTFNESRNYSLDFAHHERFASIVIEKTEIKDFLTEKYSPDEVRKISQIIAGTTPGPEKALIHSELDADRFDYLLRDSKNTGVTYGLFDLDQIIRNLDYSPDAPEGTSGLFIKKNGRKAVEDFLLARYSLYTTVIYQKTSIGFQKMANIVYEGLLERNQIESYFDLIKYFDDGEIEKFYNYNDLYILQKIRLISKGEISIENNSQYTRNADLIKNCCEKIIKRKPLKLVIEKRLIIDKSALESSSEFDRFLNEPSTIDEIVKLAQIEKHWYIPSEVGSSITSLNPLLPVDGTKVKSRDKEESILIEGEDGLPIFLIDEDSLIIKQLANSRLKISAIYTKDEEYKQKIKSAFQEWNNNQKNT